MLGVDSRADTIGDDPTVPTANELEIYAALRDILREVLGHPALTLQADTNAADIKGWDSFAQINLIVAVEGRFHVRFRSSEAQNIKRVGDLVGLIKLKIS